MGHLTWIDLLDEGWTELGVDGSGWSHWLRPDYGGAPSSESSAHGGECFGVPSLVFWSTAVPWADVGVGYSPAEVLVASERLGKGDFGVTMSKIERAAETGSAPVDWPPEVWAAVRAVTERRNRIRPRLEIGNRADFKDTMASSVGTGPTSGLFLRGG